MKIVVTGNIGCGKSTVTRKLLDLLPGYAWFDFDNAVHMLYDDEATQLALEAFFGTHDRHKISDIVHADPEQMKSLRAVMDASVVSAFRKASTLPDVIMDVPLYFEFEDSWNIEPDLIICVAADTTTQIQRVKLRNGWDEAKIRSVMNKQLPQDVKMTCADIIVPNFGSLEELDATVTRITQDHILPCHEVLT